MAQKNTDENPENETSADAPRAMARLPLRSGKVTEETKKEKNGKSFDRMNRMDRMKAEGRGV
jgi:hypothetical protein